jgi:hypothetical protein
VHARESLKTGVAEYGGGMRRVAMGSGQLFVKKTGGKIVRRANISTSFETNWISALVVSGKLHLD